jgi:peptide-methionine (S)-S-oxide reductase
MNTTELATLGGGCFWCLDAVYRGLRGVTNVESGYAGGAPDNPSYELVCTGRTGHAEVVQVTFDPSQTSFRDLLDVFFVMHDPTTLNRQGADKGTQYRSVIFYHSDAQRDTAQALIGELGASGRYDAKIVTEVSPVSAYSSAEAYHQDYFTRNPGQGYCQAVVAPKVVKARKEFFEKYSRTP